MSRQWKAVVSMDCTSFVVIQKFKRVSGLMRNIPRSLQASHSVTSVIVSIAVTEHSAGASRACESQNDSSLIREVAPDSLVGLWVQIQHRYRNSSVLPRSKDTIQSATSLY